ncbi:unnamed protein product, partial [Polarella glacialis]
PRLGLRRPRADGDCPAALGAQGPDLAWSSRLPAPRGRLWRRLASELCCWRRDGRAFSGQQGQKGLPQNRTLAAAAVDKCGAM